MRGGESPQEEVKEEEAEEGWAFPQWQLINEARLRWLTVFLRDSRTVSQGSNVTYSSPRPLHHHQGERGF
jgi:hypothetical protein